MIRQRRYVAKTDLVIFCLAYGYVFFGSIDLEHINIQRLICGSTKCNDFGFIAVDG